MHNYCCPAKNAAALHSFSYNARHHLQQINVDLSFEVFYNGYFTNPGWSTQVQLYSYDGMNRIAETDCVSPIAWVNSLTSDAQRWIGPGTFSTVGAPPLGLSPTGIGYGVCNDPKPPTVNLFQPYQPYFDEWGHNHYYLYDVRGRLLEELDLAPQASPQPCPTYKIIDHVYLGKMEVGQVLEFG